MEADYINGYTVAKGVELGIDRLSAIVRLWGLCWWSRTGASFL